MDMIFHPWVKLQLDWFLVDALKRSVIILLFRQKTRKKPKMGILGQGGRDSEIDPVSIPKLIRSRFRDEAGHGFRF
jgi:hypothetical protein